ncbi:MAG: glycosyltransferase family 39 protein [Rivularia sp. (in: Bacteria)]|nr:glycosyltransferase family 39 protein [Rivularia sp. MS3]
MLSELKFSAVKQKFRTAKGFPYLSLLVWMLPLLLLGISNNSLMAHDEGLYAWRSRLMFDSGDWINPWKTPHHKTPGFYWLTAIFYSLFGISEVSVRLPNLVGSILSIFLIYEIGKILLNKKVAWLASAILSVEFLWLQYSRLGTPDVSMVFLVLLGIWSLLKSELNSKHRYLWGLITGLSFSLGFLFRSFMIFLPIVALSPYLILHHRRHKHLANPMLYLGFVLGLAPTLIWLRLSSLRFGGDSFGELINFVTKLSSSERRNNNWTYYFWNVFILAFPWSLFSCLGGGLLIRKFLFNFNRNKKIQVTATKEKLLLLPPLSLRNRIWRQSLQLLIKVQYATQFKYSRDFSILICFPLILLIELSTFSTRLSHYSLCLYPFIALLAAVGLNWLGNIWDKQTNEIKIQNIALFSQVNFLPLYLSSNLILKTLNYVFGSLGILMLLAGTVVFFVSDIDGEIRNYAIVSLVLGLGWLTLPLVWIARRRLGKNLITARYWIGVWLISSWLSLAVTGSLGLLSNYNPDFQAFLQKPEISQTLQNNPINFVDVGGKTGVLINFYTPKHGKRVKEISQITVPSYAWIRKKQAAQISQSYRIIGEVQKYQLIELD